MIARDDAQEPLLLERPARWEVGRSNEERRSPRRRTLAAVRVLEGPELGGGLMATDLSADGAFLRTPVAVALDVRLRLSLEIPTDPRPIQVTARAVRSSPEGIGVRFEEVSARDRARLRSHAGFYEMDEAIVRVQRALGDLVPGNLLPLGEPSEIRTLLRSVVERGLPLTAIRPGRGFTPVPCRAVAWEPAGPHGATLRLDVAAPPRTRVLYLAFSDAPLFYALEGIVLAVEGGETEVMVPERVYLTERRAERRAGPRAAFCELAAPHLPEGRLRLPVMDLGEGGASIRLAAGAVLVPGARLPAFTLETEGSRREIAGATVRYLSALDDGGVRAGLRFDEGEGERDSFREIRHHTVRGGFAARISRTVSLLGGKVAAFVRRPRRTDEGGVEIVRYKNRRGDAVAAIVDANFDTSDPNIRPDVAVVIAPAILKRKEVFGLLARTILDDLDRDGRKAVVLRFDASHIAGESAMDARLVAEERPYYNWTFGHLGDDTAASLRYLQRRFRPVKRTLVSVSLSAIPARKAILECAAEAPVDLWIAPFGCPDAQDVLRNYLAGLDLFDAYRRGEGPETILIHGRPIRGASLYGQALDAGLAFLEDARKDLARIAAPVVWILGTYDCWVTRSRVRAMLDAPGGGVREVFECATGHVLKSGGEAIELFKLVAESISKHLFGADRPAREPSLARFVRQSEAEWGRVRRQELRDAEGFWKEHLFGAPGDDVGYDVFLEHPEYPRFLTRQAELLDPRPGEHLADFGCGTGNLLLALLDAYGRNEAPASLTFLDLVPEGVERTRDKVLAACSARGLVAPVLNGLVADLEVSRFAAIADFLEGRLWGVEGLVHRVEGLPFATARKLAEGYGKELHAILRGEPAEPGRVRQLCPALDEREIEIALEIGRAARFLLGRAVPEDLQPGAPADPTALTARHLRFRHLHFGDSTARLRLDLPDACFDRIGSSLVLPYLFDPLASLREMHRLLKPGGTLVVSSIRPNFDPSKLYTEGVEILNAQAAAGDESAARKLEALRHFANMISRLIELEEDGRFRFLDAGALEALLAEAGFSRIHCFQALGSPPTAIVARAEK
ncbi:MAG TPA: PilZ domain-containing protein [Thermoanaerobaculia bacterium]|nr:PilZ domain-containing protein [Thermoanaerobaculia bacterium]